MGTGTATIEAKLAQQLSGLAHEPLFLIFLFVCKANNSLERGKCMETLKGYRLGPNMAQLLGHYWQKKKIVPKAGKFLIHLFGTGCGVTQGYPALPMGFNTVVDSVVREVLVEVCGPQEAHHRIGWELGERNLIFYADEGKIVGRDPD